MRRRPGAPRSQSAQFSSSATKLDKDLAAKAAELEKNRRRPRGNPANSTRPSPPHGNSLKKAKGLEASHLILLPSSATKLDKDLAAKAAELEKTAAALADSWAARGRLRRAATTRRRPGPRSQSAHSSPPPPPSSTRTLAAQGRRTRKNRRPRRLPQTARGRLRREATRRRPKGLEEQIINRTPPPPTCRSCTLAATRPSLKKPPPIWAASKKGHQAAQSRAVSLDEKLKKQGIVVCGQPQGGVRKTGLAAA
ncbi:MAG: hypothetical protein U1F77_07875 [Kiritimatiellia bacterium]